MRTFLLTILCGSLALAARAQDTTNAPKTEIENFEALTGHIIVKGFNDAGSMTTSAGTISVRSKESSDLTTGRKEYGISVALTSGQSRGFLVVDYDELDPLLQGMDFFRKMTYDVTAMPAFDTTLATKSGLRIAAHSERRQGGIQLSLQFSDMPRILLTTDQFTQFQNLVFQAKASLDLLRNKNSAP